jgi:hypothetical protein
MTSRTRLLWAPIGKRGVIDNPNGPTPWTPQIPASAADLLEDFCRRAATLATRHSNQLGTAHHQGIPWRLKTTCPAGKPTDRAGLDAHTYGGARSRGDEVAPRMPACCVSESSQKRERCDQRSRNGDLKSDGAAISAKRTRTAATQRADAARRGGRGHLSLRLSLTGDRGCRPAT